MRMSLSTGGVLLVMLLAVPRVASAGMGEVIDGIIGLTGPQMIGVPIDCEVNLQTRARACFIAGFAPRGLPPDYAEDRKLWVVIGGGAYTSTNKDSEMRQFSWGDAHMLAFEPTVNVRSYVRPSTDDTSFALEHGVGASALYLFGDFDSFVKGGLKIRPVGVVWRNINGSGLSFGVAYNLRFFPNAFTPADFGRPGPTTHGGREFAHGFTLTLGRY